MTIRLYDTAAREKRVFEPQDPKRVTMYVCGPTVYNYAHIGNARPPIVFDVLRRLLIRTYGEGAVVYARNITDIEDKIIKASLETGAPIADITKKFAEIYNADTTALNVMAPTIEPWATGHVPEMIDMIEKLVRRGYAYVGKEGVWFSVKQMKDYGKLSGRKLEDNEAGARVEVDADKRDPADFALWKFAKPGEPEDAIWDSPWGRGRPGWHIECSAMAAKHLGKTIDIHGGGIDLQFPHHENEIAQSECAHGEVMANYWMHNGFLDMGGEKMSKSLGNVVLVHELLEQWEKGEIIRFAMLSGQYRAPLDWSEDLLKQAKTTLDRIYGALRRVWDADGGEARDTGVLRALEDDLNTPEALAELSRLAGEANTAADQKNSAAMANAKANLLSAGQLLGLLQSTPEDWFGIPPAILGKVIDLRKKRELLRASKNWADADQVKLEMKDLWVDVMDGAKTSLRYFADEPKMRELFNSHYLQPMHAQFLNSEWFQKFSNSQNRFRFDDIVQFGGKRIFLEYKITTSTELIRKQIVQFRNSFLNWHLNQNDFFYVLYPYQGDFDDGFEELIHRVKANDPPIGIGFLKGTGKVEMIADPARLNAG